MGMTFAIFKTSGYSPFLIDKLKSFDSVSATTGADMLIKMPGRSSLPVDFFGLILLIWYWTSGALVSHRLNDCSTGLPKNFLNVFGSSLSIESARFWPIFVKNLLKESVISVEFVFISFSYSILVMFTLFLSFYNIFPKIFQRFKQLLL